MMRVLKVERKDSYESEQLYSEVSGSCPERPEDRSLQRTSAAGAAAFAAGIAAAGERSDHAAAAENGNHH